MPAPEPFYRGVSPSLSDLTIEEKSILEINFFARLCDELIEIFRSQYQGYLNLMKFSKSQVLNMIEENLIRFIIEDILATEAYTLEGIAVYTGIPQDVIFEIATGQNTNPTYRIVRRIIELHRSIKPNFYKNLITKIIETEKLQ